MTPTQEHNLQVQVQWLTERYKELIAEQKELGQRVSMCRMDINAITREKENGN